MPVFRLTKRLAFTSLLPGAALAFAVACGSDDDDHAAAGDGGGADAMTVADAPADATVGLTDGQIWQILVTFDQGEITEADVAVGKASTPALLELYGSFAVSYDTVDAQLVQLAGRLRLVPAPSDEATSLAAATTADEAVYAPLEGTAFDSAYLSARISAGEALLTLIDTQLAPAVTNPDLGGLIGVERGLLLTNVANAQVALTTLAADAGPDAAVDSGTDAALDAAPDAGDAAEDGGNAADAADAADADAAPDADDASDAGADAATDADADAGD